MFIQIIISFFLNLSIIIRFSSLLIQKCEKCMFFVQHDRWTTDLIARNNEGAIRIKMTYVHFHFVLHA